VRRSCRGGGRGALSFRGKLREATFLHVSRRKYLRHAQRSVRRSFRLDNRACSRRNSTCRLLNIESQVSRTRTRKMTSIPEHSRASVSWRTHVHSWRATIRRGRPHPVSWVVWCIPRWNADQVQRGSPEKLAKPPSVPDVTMQDPTRAGSSKDSTGSLARSKVTRRLDTWPRRGAAASRHLSSRAPSSRKAARRARCQRAGDTHARKCAHTHAHARTYTRTHVHRHTQGSHCTAACKRCTRAEALPIAETFARPELFVSGMRHLSRGEGGGVGSQKKEREKERERERERERVANLANLVGQTAWIGLLGCRSRRWLRHRANSIALLDIDGYGGDGGGDAAATTAVAAAGKRRLSIFPRSLHDRNTPVRVSPAGAPASPVGGLLGPARSLEPRFSSSSLPPPLSSSFSLSLSPSFSRAYLLAVPLTRVINGVSATDGRPHRGLAVIGNPVRK